MSGRAGVDKVLAEDAAEAPAQAEARQLPLLPGSAEAPPAAAAPAEGDGKGGPGRGRPPGAKNRRTDEWVRYLNTFGQGPLVGLARVVASMRFDAKGMPDPSELAKALGMKRKEAAAFWAACARDLAPYMHQKLPIAVDITGDSAGSLVVVNLGAVQGDAATDLGGLLGGHLGDVIDGEAAPGEDEENQ